MNFTLARESLRNGPLRNAWVYTSFSVAGKKSDNRALGHEHEIITTLVPSVLNHSVVDHGLLNILVGRAGPYWPKAIGLIAADNVHSIES